MKRILNYIGQMRLYSLADLILPLIAVGSNRYELIGAVILHLGFLAYLESKHAHAYRLKIPNILSYILFVIGALVYGKREGFFVYSF